MTIRDLMNNKKSFMVETTFIYEGKKYFLFIEGLDQNGGGITKDFDNKHLTNNVLVEIGLCGTGETFATLEQKVNIDYDLETLKYLAINQIIWTVKEQNKKIIDKYLSVLGWGFESEEEITTYDQLRDHLDKIEQENPHLTYWDYPIEEVIDRIQNNEIFFCIGGRMFETHQFLISTEE